MPKMQDLRAALVRQLPDYVLAHLPIHRRLQTILYSKRAALDKKVALQRRQPHYALERRYKLGVALRINIRVRDLDFRRAQQIASHLRFIEMRMVESDRHRAEKSVKINQSAIIDCVVQIRAAAFVEIDDDLETIEQDVLLDGVEHDRWRDWSLSFALCGSVSIPHCAGRFREFATANLSYCGHGRNTHC